MKHFIKIIKIYLYMIIQQAIPVTQRQDTPQAQTSLKHVYNSSAQCYASHKLGFQCVSIPTMEKKITIFVQDITINRDIQSNNIKYLERANVTWDSYRSVKNYGIII